MSPTPHQSKILLAEDCLDTQEVLRFLLEQTGAEIVVANNGQECVDRLHEDDFQLIILDVKMPVVDGVSALRQLRREGFQSPVVALSASPTEEVRARMNSLGVEAFLDKTTDRKSILPTITGILKRVERIPKTIPQRVEAIYPELENDPSFEPEDLLSFLRKLRSVSFRFRYALKKQAYSELSRLLREVQDSSSFGYKAFGSEVDSLQEILKTDAPIEVVHSKAVAAHRTMLGILEGEKSLL